MVQEVVEILEKFAIKAKKIGEKYSSPVDINHNMIELIEELQEELDCTSQMRLSNEESGF